jgi:hypothetical protein
MGVRNTECVSTFKYLGVLFLGEGDWDTHSKHDLQRMNTAVGAWYPLFTYNEPLVPVRLMIVGTFVYSAVTYCSSS